jgi:spore coat protein F
MEERAKSLAWHETLELHELIVSNATCLFKLKKMASSIQEPELKQLYIVSIQTIEGNLKELLPFISNIQGVRDEEDREDYTGFYAGELLGTAKTAVRNYAIAITETATPELREVLIKQLQGAIRWHESIFNYMYKKGLYPAYDLTKLLSNDVKNARTAINLKY